MNFLGFSSTKNVEKIAELEETIVDMQNEVNELNESIKRYEDMRLRKDDRILKLENALSAKENEVKNLKTVIFEKTKDLETHQAASYKTQEEMRTTLSKRKQQLKKLASEYDHLGEEMAKSDAMRDQLLETQNKMLAQIKCMENVTRENERLKQDMEALRKQCREEVERTKTSCEETLAAERKANQEKMNEFEIEKTKECESRERISIRKMARMTVDFDILKESYEQLKSHKVQFSMMQEFKKRKLSHISAESAPADAQNALTNA